MKEEKLEFAFDIIIEVLIIVKKVRVYLYAVADHCLQIAVVPRRG